MREAARAADGSLQMLVPWLLPTDEVDRLRQVAAQSDLAVVVDRRRRERRSGGDRREDGLPVDPDRRRIRSRSGRRMGERRARSIRVDPPAALAGVELPEGVVLIERVQPTSRAVEDLDTARLVTDFQSGERSAFAAIYERYFDRVYGYFRVSLRDPHEAEDATQQVFIHALEKLSSFEFRGAPFRAWLFRIVRNDAIDHLARRYRLDVVEVEAVERRRADAPARVDIAMPGWLSDEDLVMLVERLPLAQRQVILLRYMMDLGFAEIGEILERSPEAARQLQQRALVYLRDRLRALGKEREEAVPPSRG